MPDLTAELQRMADDAAHRAQSLEADEVIREGDRRRRRSIVRRSAGGLSVAGITAAVVLAVSALVPSGPPASRQPAAPLAAWTVVKQPGGTVSITIREFRDPAGLQARLRSDGVPASVIFYPAKLQRGLPFRDLFRVSHNPCQEFPDQNQLLKVVPPHRAPLQGSTTISIRPAALPNGAGLQFIATTNVGSPTGSGRHALGVWLVQATPRCTGS
ncbi:MAG: hypothetical protein ACRDNF_17015 [Streptosporangiaceae bacterium]